MTDAEDRSTIATSLTSALGHTRNGEPLSNNRAPAEDLSPWIARVYATQVETTADSLIDCSLVSDTPVLRVLLKGDWTAETRDGISHYGPSALLFGPQSKSMSVRVRGSFSTVGVALKPGAMPALRGPKVPEMVDRIIRYDDIYPHQGFGTGEELLEWFGTEGPPERWLKVAEKLLRQLIELTGAKKPDPIIDAFDKAAFADPNMRVRDFAQENGIEMRRLERLVKSAYGLPPKQVLRRARALDIAANLRGVADDAEAEEIALRYYDQSHMIREFTAFFGMTPKQFVATPQPFMTITLEARQSRRLEVLGRHDPTEGHPWRRGD